MASSTRMAMVLMMLPACAVGQNVALNKAVRVSSNFSTYLGPLAVDGVVNRPSRWISAPASPGNIPYIIVDLNDTYAITEVNIWAGIDGGTTWGLCDHTVDIYLQPATSLWSLSDVNTQASSSSNWQTIFSGGYGTLFQHSGTANVRFVRVMANAGSGCAAGTNSRARIIELQVTGELAPSGATLGGTTISNVAIGAQTVASTNSGGSTSGMAVDGNSGTLWQAAATNTWLLVDLGQIYNVTRFSVQGVQNSRNAALGMCWHNISMYTGTSTDRNAVSTDTNSANWVVLTQIRSRTVIGNENDDIRPVQGRFFKLSMNNQPCPNAATRISEFEIYGTTDPVGLNAGLQNVAMYKQVLADSTLTNRAGTYFASNAVDGVTDINTGSRWVSTNTQPYHWLAINLGANFLISSISVSPDDIGNGARGVCSYQLQVWTGVSNANLRGASRSNCGWTTIYDTGMQQTPAFITQNHDFPPIVGRMVRLVVNQTGCARTDNYARIYEVQIYGVEQPNTILADGTNTSLAGSAGLVPNVALGKRAIADSNLSSVYIPAKAFDGDNSSRTSRWVSAADTDQHWLAVDLAGMYLIQGINLVTGYANSNGLCSHNISVYTGLYTTLETAVSDPNNWAVVLMQASQIVTIEHSAVTPPTYGQFVMLTVDQSPCGWSNHARVYELEVFATPAPPGTTPRAIENAALGKTGIASTFLNEGPPGGYQPNNAFDGRISSASRWVSNRTGDPRPWIAVDLEAQYILYGASMVVGWPGSLCLTGLCSYNISVYGGSANTLSNAAADSAGWTNLIVNDQYTHDEATHDEFPPASQGQYVMLSIDQTNCANFSGVYAREVLSGIVRVMEFRVFGVAITQSPTATPTAVPTVAPVAAPTSAPTVSPTARPTMSPTARPSRIPTPFPTRPPSPAPTNAPVTAANAAGITGSGETDLLLIVVIVALVIILVVVVVVFKKKNNGGASRGDGVAFDNPLYDDSSKQMARAKESVVDDGEYMDINTAEEGGGYMDVEPEHEDGF